MQSRICQGEASKAHTHIHQMVVHYASLCTRPLPKQMFFFILVWVLAAKHEQSTHGARHPGTHAGVCMIDVCHVPGGAVCTLAP